jgi:hypothetical protein
MGYNYKDLKKTNKYLSNNQSKNYYNIDKVELNYNINHL